MVNFNNFVIYLGKINIEPIFLLILSSCFFLAVLLHALNYYDLHFVFKNKRDKSDKK